ncbi:MAG: universal stress protein [Chakrabartia godavariana]
MKSVLLHIFEDEALNDRLSVALDVCRAHDAHLTCAYVTPFASYVGLDPMGGVFTSSALVDSLREAEDRVRAQVESRLAHEDVRWDWQSFDGDPAQTLISASSLADLVILSQAGRDRVSATTPLPIVDVVAVNAGCAVLVVPTGVNRYDAKAPVVVGWNASEEAARAIRDALPALQLAAAVTLVSVGEEGEDYPSTDASAYLSRHGVGSDLRTFAEGDGAADALLQSVAAELGAGAILIGAYGHSRLRETLLGGVTRRLATQSRIPVLLGR